MDLPLIGVATILAWYPRLYPHGVSLFAFNFWDPTNAATSGLIQGLAIRVTRTSNLADYVVAGSRVPIRQNGIRLGFLPPELHARGDESEAD